MIKIPGTGGGFGANGSDGGVDGTFGVELILKCIMCITSKVFYETMINDERFSLFCGNLASFSKKKEREKKKFLCFVGERDTFFSKARKDLRLMDKKETKKRAEKEKNIAIVRQITHAFFIHYNNDDDSGVSRAVVVHRGERFGREILARGDRRKRRRLVA